MTIGDIATVLAVLLAVAVLVAAQGLAWPKDRGGFR